MASMLYAVETPPYGGDTLFANQYLAYETLSEGLRKRARRRWSASIPRPRPRRRRPARTACARPAWSARCWSGEHPVVRTHPETGRKALYVNVGHTTHFKGWTEEESAPLLAFCSRTRCRPEFTCRFAGTPGSLAFWDNRCVQHNPVNDYHGRVMHRVTLAGDTPR